ncbi:MAG: DUF6531 domain-containing protein [Pseudomonadota bacterium]|nr:DUF6531 domain-containing protein [Pseudomonadota bacterium]
MCFPRYREAGAVPGTQSCPLTASTAKGGMATYFCTSSSGVSRIERYCSTVPKNLGACESTPHPIAIGTANKSLAETDLEGADGLLSLKRFYNSSEAAGQGEMLGGAWRSGFESKVVASSEGASVYRPDGRIFHFSGRGSAYVADGDVNDTLVRVSGTPGGWHYVDMSAGRVEAYDTAGRLTRLTRHDGRSLTLTYSTADTPAEIAPGADYLIAVTDPFGRALRFYYDDSKRLRAAVDASGHAYGYAYDANANLAAVSTPDGHHKTYSYNESTQTGGEHLPGALTGIADSTHGRVASYSYAQGRATGELRLADAGTPVDNYQIVYDRYTGYDEGSGATHASGQSTVIDPLGTRRVHTFAQVLGVTRGTGVSQPGGSGCAASSSHVAYDARGNVSRRDDFNEHRSCMAYDARNRESLRSKACTRTPIAVQ